MDLLDDDQNFTFDLKITKKKKYQRSNKKFTI